MSAWASARSLAIGLGISSILLAGCVADESSDGSGSSGGSAGYGSSTGGSSGSSSGSSTGQPMLVDVDPNRTMTASPGEGVGVFTQYQTGGHWYVWWTCDTNVSSEPCSYDIAVSVSTGTIANVASQAFESTDSVSQASSQQLEAFTTTSTAVDGITFDTVVPDGTTPVITLDAKLDGQDSGSFLYFVQDGSINGDYAGTLTDPLMLEPSSP